MDAIWFVLLALLIALYVVLDGFDLGAGTLLFVLGHDREERERITNAIGPVWNGNEVWVVAAGGMLFLAFPKAYAGAFSGLYFGMMLVLWLLVGRGLALELRHQLDHPLWHDACDVVFCVSSALLAFVLGGALGNVVRGVPLGHDGYFQLTLFHTLNWFAILTGLAAVVGTASQAASFLAIRAGGRLGKRAGDLAKYLVPAQIISLLVMIGPTYAVRHNMLNVFTDHPWTIVFPALALGAMAYALVCQRADQFQRAFVAVSAAVAAVIATMAAGIFPWILPAHDGHRFGLSIYSAATNHHALAIALAWFPVGIALGLAYSVFAYRILFRSPPA